jgi:replicative DNA helicase
MNSTDNPDPSERMLSSREIEMAVLGAMLLEPKTVGSLVVARLTDKHFEHAAHQILFCEITAILRENGVLDLVTLTQRLEDKDLLDGVGGPAYLAHLICILPTIAGIEKYVDKMADKGKHDSM